MLYLSRLHGKPVYDSQGTRVGSCHDILVSGLDRRFPYVRAIAINTKNRGILVVRADQIKALEPQIALRAARADLQLYAPRGDELWLMERIMNHQIVDMEGHRLVHVRDVQIAQTGDRICLTGVDVSPAGLVRRLGIGPLTALASRLAGDHEPEGIIPWQAVAPIQKGEPIRLRISEDKIAKLHPADIAELLNSLDADTSQALISTLDDVKLADAMEEIPAQMQVEVVGQMEPERAADVLEEMAPDEAADLLADLPQERGEELLGLMETDTADDVRKLLTYREDTAGGIMTTEFATLPAGLKADQALDYLRHSEEAQDDEAMYHIYVVDDEHRLHGVVSLRTLVMAAPDTPVADLTDTPITVGPDTSQSEVAYVVAKYNLLSVPVVNGDGRLQGIVTVDDAIDAILPTTWKKRLPRFF